MEWKWLKWPWKKHYARRREEEIDRRAKLTPEERAHEDHVLMVNLHDLSIALMRGQNRRNLLWGGFLVVVFVTVVIGVLMLPTVTKPVEVEEVWETFDLRSEGSGTAEVAIMYIRDTIGGDLFEKASTENTVRYVAETLKKLKDADNLAGVVLYIDTYGGSAARSAEIYRRIRKFAEKHDIPVSAYVQESSYSGGYYIACAARRIVIGPDATIGNIGVIERGKTRYRFGQWFGIDETNVKSGPQKDAGDEYKRPDPNDAKFRQQSVDRLMENFLTAVSQARNIPLDQLKKELKTPGSRVSGAWFSGEDARSENLADDVMEYDDFIESVVASLRSEGKYRKVKFVKYDIRKHESLADGLARRIVINLPHVQTGPGESGDPQGRRPRFE